MILLCGVAGGETEAQFRCDDAAGTLEHWSLHSPRLITKKASEKMSGFILHISSFPRNNPNFLGFPDIWVIISARQRA